MSDQARDAIQREDDDLNAAHARIAALEAELEGVSLDYGSLLTENNALEAELQQARDSNRQNLQKELLDLITLMPDSQTQELVDHIMELRAIRAHHAEPSR